jgi:hypothetical protein
MPVATANHFKGVVGLALALPCSFLALPLAADDDRSAFATFAQALSGEQTLLDWRSYAYASIVPDFDWADRPEARAPDLSTLAFGGVNRARFGSGRLGVSVESSTYSLREGARAGGAFAPLKITELAPVGLRQEIFSPGVVAQTRYGQFELGAVFAYQRFASWDFGAFSASEVGLGVLDDSSGRVESSFGQGVRAGMSRQLTPKLGFQAGYSSKIDMDAFNTYRGVYSAPGDFDLPASLDTRLSYRLGATTALTLGVEYIQYSQVEPFLSSTLPNRVVALLGDGNSPEFSWRDLTVYSAEWSWTPSSNDAFALRYSTRQQPTPESPALRRALAADFTDNNVAVAYSRRLGPGLKLGFAASYSPSSYFLGFSDPFARPLDSGEQIEAELLFTALF